MDIHEDILDCIMKINQTSSYLYLFIVSTVYDPLGPFDLSHNLKSIECVADSR
jgi:hypothetical protein